MLHPINQYIEIQLIPEPPQEILTELPPLQKALLVAASPDIELPCKKGDLIQVYRGRAIQINQQLFIHKDYLPIYANSNNHGNY